MCSRFDPIDVYICIQSGMFTFVYSYYTVPLLLCVSFVRYVELLRINTESNHYYYYT